MDLATFVRASEVYIPCNKSSRITVRLGVTDALMLQTLCNETEMTTTEIVSAGIRALFGLHKSLAGDEPDDGDTNKTCPD